MIIFNDYYDNEVKLSFEDHPFSKHPKHVWVVCRFENQWLLTRHKRRGLEFPGGKVELNEDPKDAAIREVYEETGGTVSKIVYIGQYEVKGRGGTIVKNVYFAEIDKLEERPTYYETLGPVTTDTFPSLIERAPEYSFMMKDRVLVESLSKVQKENL